MREEGERETRRGGRRELGRRLSAGQVLGSGCKPDNLSCAQKPHKKLAVVAWVCNPILPLKKPEAEREQSTGCLRMFERA